MKVQWVSGVVYFSKPGGSHCHKPFQSVIGGRGHGLSQSSVPTQKRHHTDIRDVWPGTELGREGEMLPGNRVIPLDVPPALPERTVESLLSLKSYTNSRQFPLVSNKLAISNKHIYLCYSDSISSSENQMCCLATASFSLLTFHIP